MRIARGHSEKNSILFISNNCAEAKVTKNKNEKIVEYTVEYGKQYIKTTIYEKLLKIFVIFILIGGLIFLKNYNWVANTLEYITYYITNILGFSSLVFCIMLIIPAINKYINKDIEEYRNHAAEHMVCSYFKKYNSPPKSIRKLKKFSRINHECGSIMIGCVLEAFLCTWVNNLLLGPNLDSLIILLIYYIFYLVRFSILGYVLQFLFTAKPSNDNLEIAMLANNILYDFEEIFSVSTFILNSDIRDEYMYKNDIKKFILKIIEKDKEDVYVFELE